MSTLQPATPIRCVERCESLARISDPTAGGGCALFIQSA